MTEVQSDLARLEQAERMLAQVATVEEAVALRDFAEAARVMAKQAKLGTASINHATVVKLRAERRIAEYVDAGQAAGQIATREAVGRNRPPESGGLSTYAELGLSTQRVAEARTICNQYGDAELVALGTAATVADRLLSRDKIVRLAGWKDRADQQGRYAGTAGLTHADVLLVDPPWRYDFSVTQNRDIENQYPTMTDDELAAIPLPVGDDVVLFCWATSPKLTNAMTLLEAWRLTYRTSMVWIKDRIGMGYYARQRHEWLLIATRGHPRTPEPADRPDSVIEAPRAVHSAKPDAVYDLIERMYPNASKRELFARRRRDGWLEPWGLDVAQ